MVNTEVFGIWGPRGEKVVEVRGIEPLAPCMQSRCSPAELHPHVFRHKSLKKVDARYSQGTLYQ